MAATTEEVPRPYGRGTSSVVFFVVAMNRVDVVDLVVNLVDVDLDVDLVDVDLDVDLVDVDLVDADLADIGLVEVDFEVDLDRDRSTNHAPRVFLDFLVLKNAPQQTSQYVKWTSGARVLS